MKNFLYILPLIGLVIFGFFFMDYQTKTEKRITFLENQIGAASISKPIETIVNTNSDENVKYTEFQNFAAKVNTFITKFEASDYLEKSEVENAIEDYGYAHQDDLDDLAKKVKDLDDGSALANRVTDLEDNFNRLKRMLNN